MNIKEFYESVIDHSGNEYANVMRRLGSERLVNKYLKKMTEDKSFGNLKEAIASGDYKGAFMAAHTIKGICMNLGLKTLTDSSSALTEELRNNPDPTRAEALLKEVEKDYEAVTEGIRSIE